MAAPVEAKVQTTTLTAGLTGVVLYALGKWVFKNEVPDVVQSWVYIAVPAVLTFVAGYFTKHTPRSIEPVTPTTTTVASAPATVAPTSAQVAPPQ